MMMDQSSNPTRSSLLQRASQRDAQAWRELVDLYGPLVAHSCRRCQLDSHSTGDLQLQQLTSRALPQVQSEFEARTWQAFWRSVVDGISTSRVAQELNMSEAAVRQSRSRILRRLRQQLGDGSLPST